MDRFAQGLMLRAPAWIIVGVVGMLAMALSSGIQPWAAALGGVVFPADLAADAAAAHLFVQRISPYSSAIREVHEALTGLPHDLTLPHFPHPPFSLIVAFPLGFTSFQTAAVAWFALTMALLFVLAAIIRNTAVDGVKSDGLSVGMLWLLLLAWPPVLYNLEKGQWSVLIAVLLAVAWRPTVAGDLRVGAIWAGVAASVKVFPVLLGVYFLIRSGRAAVWFAGTGIALLTLPLLWIGFSALPEFIHESRLNLPYWESFPLVMFSVHGAVTRALVGGRWAEPLVYAPILARVIEAAVVTLLLAAASWATVQARRGIIDHPSALLVWLTILPILNPLSLGHNGVLLALPLVVLARTLAVGEVGWQQWSWSLSLVLVSLPNQTVWRLAGLPASPVEGLAIAAMPTWGALLLFAIAFSIACRRRHSGSAVPSATLDTSPAATHGSPERLPPAGPCHRIRYA